MHVGTWTGTAAKADEYKKLHDDKNLVDYTDETEKCYFQIQYKENYAGLLDEAKFFVN